MHDPSLFLPSSKFHRPPIYSDNRFRRTNCGEEDEEEKNHEKLTKSNFSHVTENPKIHKMDGLDILSRFGKIATLSVTNSNRDGQKTTTGAENGEEELFGSCFEKRPHSSYYYPCEKIGTTLYRTSPHILVNGEAMLSSVQDITSLIDNVAGHTHQDVKCMGEEEEEAFFEVSNEWAELSIAREEEVMSSEFEEMTSPQLDDIYVYLDI